MTRWKKANPFPSDDPRHRPWDEATASALAMLRHYDDGLAAPEIVSGDPGPYERRWLDLAAMRFDTWSRRGLAGREQHGDGTRLRDVAADLRYQLARVRG